MKPTSDILEPRYSEFKITKKSGKQRLIVNPSVELKAYQKYRVKYFNYCFKFLLASYGLNDIFHGFVRGHSAVTAAYKHIGYQATVMCDIKNFFDSITREKVEYGLRLTLQPIDAKLLFHESGYTAQGFCTSPTLANIAILPYVKTIYETIMLEFPGSCLTIYADDFQISYNEDTIEAKDRIVEIISEELAKADLQLNPGKTRVRRAKLGFRRILGVNVGETEIRATRKVVRKVRAVNHQVKVLGNSVKGTVLGGLTAWKQSPKNYQKKQL